MLSKGFSAERFSDDMLPSSDRGLATTVGQAVTVVATPNGRDSEHEQPQAGSRVAAETHAQNLQGVKARSASRPTKTATWGELQNGALSLLDQAIVSATSFATSVIIGRMCSKEQLGIFYLALTIVYLAKAVQDTVIAAPYVIYYHGRRGESRALYSGSVLLHYIALSIVSCLILAGMVSLVSFGIGPIGVLPALWVLLMVLPFIQLREFVRRLVIAHLRLSTVIVIDLVVGSAQIGMLVALAYYERLTIPRAFAVMGTACAIPCLAWYCCVRRSMRLDWSRAIADWRHNWKFARWALASHSIGFATLYVTPWIVTALRGNSDAGVLAACISVVGVASMFMTGLSAFLTPRAAIAFETAGASELRRFLNAATTVYIAALGSFAIAVFASGDRLLVLAFGGKYAGYGAVLGVLALATLALSIGLTAGIGLWAIDQPRANLVADVCTLTITLILVVALLPWLGVLGAALGDLAGKSAGALVRQATLFRLLETIPRRAVIATP